MGIYHETNAQKFVEIIERSFCKDEGYPSYAVLDGQKRAARFNGNGSNGNGNGKHNGNHRSRRLTPPSWTVMGIPPETQAFAEFAARREGLFLGEWLHRVVREAAQKTVAANLDRNSSREDLICQLTKRIQKLEAHLGNKHR